MGLIRFIVLLLILSVLWFMAKNYLRKQQQRTRNEQPRISGKIVRCKYCEVHLPEQEALREGDDWFCSQAHKQAWLTKHKL